MPINAEAQKLHDRATRGELLTLEEQAQLQAWYDEQDQVEFEQRNLAAMVTDDSALNDQIQAALNQLTAATAQIQKLALENDALRRENLAIRRQLSEQPLLQHA